MYVCVTTVVCEGILTVYRCVFTLLWLQLCFGSHSHVGLSVHTVYLWPTTIICAVLVNVYTVLYCTVLPVVLSSTPCAHAQQRGAVIALSGGMFVCSFLCLSV